MEQSFEIGVKSILPVSITGLFTGLVLSAQSYCQVGSSLPEAVGFFVTKSMLVEIGPVLTAMVMVGRVGASLAAFLGTMCITEQVTAMKSMGVDPLQYFVFPRVIAGMICMPVLSVLSAWIGILMGYVLCISAFRFTSLTYWSMVIGKIGFTDVFLLFLKSWIFGLLIISTACFQGLRVGESSSDVGNVTTESVVFSYIGVLVVNCILTFIFNSIFG
ncbi:MAG: ABC transporter permease [Victivallaceae bacterium]